MQNMNTFYTQLVAAGSGSDFNLAQHSYLSSLARLRQLKRYQLRSLTTLLLWSGWSA